MSILAQPNNFFSEKISSILDPGDLPGFYFLQMKFQTLIAFLGFIFFISCNAPVTRKVVVMGRGKITIANNKIIMKDGTGYAEEKIELQGNDPSKWEINAPNSTRTLIIPEERGTYILNLKTDTIVGSQQKLGVDISKAGPITQEEIKLKIDSLTKLIHGDNVVIGHNYFIVPGQLSKISSNAKARIYGPFTLISNTIEAEDDNSMPEIYKFFTNTEMRQLIEKFKKMTTI